MKYTTNSLALRLTLNLHIMVVFEFPLAGYVYFVITTVPADSILFIFIPASYIKSLLSTFTIDKAAKSKEIAVKIMGNTALPAIVKSPMFACVRKINKNEVTIVAFEDFKAIPTNRAIKLMLTITTDFSISCI